MRAQELADRSRILGAARRLGMLDPTVTALQGGSRNRCYRLVEGSRDVVLRIAADDDATYSVDRDAELLAHRLAAAHGLAPGLLLDDREARFIVMEHVPGPVWSREFAASPSGAARLGEWLGRLHDIVPPAGLRQVDFAAVLDGYCRSLGPGPIVSRLAQQASGIARALQPAGRAVFCHNDLHHLNLVEAPGQLYAVDWEYAGAGQAVMDLAGYVAYHELAPPAIEALIAAYDTQQPRPVVESLLRARWLFEAVWWAWLELMRRAAAVEPDQAAATRRRLEVRLAQAVTGA